MPPRGVAVGFIVIPVLGSEVCEEVVWNKRKAMGQVHQGVYDETCGEWVTFGMR